ncbi:ABC transporter ATP-binding protein [Bacillus timonensis]|nr:ABC transporter ATP-binding protein [Bacillus timonensis]
MDVQNVTKIFRDNRRGNDVTAITDISVHLKRGEFVSILGPSGCGKSTLLDIIAGLEIPTDGQVFYEGNVITGKKGFVSYMPQKDVLFPWRTVLENVIVPLELKNVTKKHAMQEAKALLPLFGLENFANSYPDALSGGMRQRASFLRTYLSKKDCMILDEPFGRLDAITRVQMQQWLLSIWEQLEKSILMVTHDIDEAIMLSDRIYVLSPRPGKVIREIEISIDRPRTHESMTTEEFMSIKKSILHTLSI